ncbi:MAG: DUF1326 domain-containing protein [Gammaproteobacteria bacterium]|nr:DUF1326 domain-containing protein [Gammaproteobacteria bacterium]
MIPWEFKGRELVNCNCAWGCPCQFNALPTKGFCEAVGAFHIDEGHYGDVKLDGLTMITIIHWPGPIHEGRGRCQPIVDERANDAQRQALLKIMSGEDTDPFATVFAVFATTFEEVYEPLFRPIEFEADVDGRRGRIRVEGLVDTVGEPIRNPVTGTEHRARIDLPNGFEYSLAEMGSGTTTTKGRIELNLKDSYAQFAHLHLNNHGIVRA